MKARLLVYGTLKQGHGNHRYLKDSEFLGRCCVEGNYSLIDMGAFPGIVDTPPLEKPARIWCEAYSIDEATLHSCDMLEGNGHFYTRKKVATPFKNAWLYTLPPVYSETYSPIMGTVWRPTHEEATYIASNS